MLILKNIYHSNLLLYNNFYSWNEKDEDSGDDK